MDNVHDFVSIKIKKHVDEFMRKYRLQGKGAAGRYFEGIPELYKADVALEIKKKFNDKGI